MSGEWEQWKAETRHGVYAAAIAALSVQHMTDFRGRIPTDEDMDEIIDIAGMIAEEWESRVPD